MTTYAFSDEQLQLRDSTRRFLHDHANTKRTRELMDDPLGYDRTIYQRLLSELGIGGVHVPQDFGGVGLSYVELCIVLEEMGRALYPSPYLMSNVLAVNALLLAGSETQKSQLIPKIVTGDTVVTVCVYEDSNRTNIDAIKQVVHDGTFSGVKHNVIDGMAADQFVLIAKDANQPDGPPKFWLAQTQNSGISKTLLQGIDSTRRIARIEFDAVPVELLSATDRGSETFYRFLALAYVALANEMAGGTQQLLESSVAYANERVQFGRTISSMQAIKHKCADLLLTTELAKSAAYRAAQACALHENEMYEYASIAKAAANDAYMQAASDAIQIHGGIGFTWENDTHLWFKRAKSSEVLFGTSEWHREELLNRMNGISENHQ